uniref:PH domain-containing protein n=1 Tax=Oncorhynchus mykiss TaxID=8022 RepID=A0A8C7P1Z5_ONCMY
MNQCSDVIDGESRTGQKNSLCVLTPDREHFIRAECREIINGWQEALTVYPRTNKQNQKKKRKVEPPTPQEPGPAKVTVTSSGGSIPCLPSSIASAERVPASRSTLWQEERWSRASTIPCSRSASCLSQLTQSHPGSKRTVNGGRKVRVESGYFSLEKTKSPEPPQPPQHQPLTTSTSLGVLHHRYSPCDSPSYPNTSLNYPSSDPLPSPGALLSPSYSTVSSSQSSLDSEPSSNALSWDSRGGAGGNVGGGGGGRVGRPGKDYVVLSNVPRARRLSHREAFRSDKKRVELRARTRSPGREEVARLFGLERRRSQVIGKFESGDGEGVEHMDTTSPSEPPSNTVSVQRQGRSERRSLACKQVICCCFLFSILRYYRDSIAEEAADMDGEIDLSTCYDVTEFPVQRNYGFQILSKVGACTLSAMTSGIRRNWIQAIMKNARPTIAPPDVTRSLLEEKARGRVALHPSPQPGPDPSPESPRVEVRPRKSRVRERRREGRSKTYDWSEFQPGQTEDPKRDKAPDTVDPSSASSSSTSSSSSSTSSLASSPVSTTSSPPTSSSISAPPPGRGSAVATREEAEQERGRRRDERQQRFKQNTHAPGTSQDQGRMEVDHPEPGAEGSGESDGRAPDVQVEIEQRWHQVETTPLREEKQVPISTTDACLTERLPPQELAALLDKELGQTQKELARLQEQNNMLQEQLEDARGREHSAREGYVLQATCERGFTAMEETHHKVVEDLQRQHQREVSKLLEEKERLLAEETAATIAAIEAMKNAHREEMEKNQRSQISGLSTDIDELHEQYQEELQSIQRELEVLSEQYSQKCLENAHLAQALEAERQALRQCQRENQELNAHNQELNNRLTVEITRMRSCYSGETALSPFTQGKDLYELEVLLRIKESEIQYLKQEIHSLKDELQSALRDKKYATDKYKDIYTELSIVKAKADCDITKLTEKLLVATEALGERNVDGSATPGYDIMKSKSNPDFLKKERSTLSKQIRGVRSKVR